MDRRWFQTLFVALKIANDDYLIEEGFYRTIAGDERNTVVFWKPKPSSSLDHRLFTFDAPKSAVHGEDERVLAMDLGK